MKLFIDCGVNRGQSIWAFSEYMKDNSSWDYVGFEPAIGGLNRSSMQVNEMRKNVKKRCENCAKRPEKDRKRPENNPKTIENGPKTIRLGGRHVGK